MFRETILRLDRWLLALSLALFASGMVVDVFFPSGGVGQRIAELLCEMTGRNDLAPVHAEPRPADVARHFADIDKAKRLFGFAPRIDIESGLARTLAWFRTHEIARRPEADGAGSPNWYAEGGGSGQQR